MKVNLYVFIKRLKKYHLFILKHYRLRLIYCALMLHKSRDRIKFAMICISALILLAVCIKQQATWNMDVLCVFHHHPKFGVLLPLSSHT